MKKLPTQQQAFNEGLKLGTKMGRHKDLSGFFTPYPNNATLRTKWIEGFKQGFKQQTGVDYPLAATQAERLDLFAQQLEALSGV